ncbi:MAG: ABC transporter substrate-binding protein [Acidimicrobiales bacterium]
MALRIMPHGRLQEWVADERGHFAAEGLDYEFLGGPGSPERSLRADHPGSEEIREGAFEAYETGRGVDVSCACHWAVNQAAATNLGKMWGGAYSVTPGAIMVPPESPIRSPGDLAGVEVAVGFHSGSHFSTVQALESCLASSDIKVTFQGLPNDRLDAAIDRRVAAADLWGVPMYVAEEHGFVKVLDTTFVIGFLFDERVERDDIERYFRALQRAQSDIDLHPERYRHYHLKVVPERYQASVDVRKFGTGERIVFLPYSGDAYDETQEWMQARGLFDPTEVTSYESAVLAEAGGR